MLLVQGSGEMAVLPAVPAILLLQCAIDTWTDCNVVSTGLRGNGVSACSYCSTVTSLNNNLKHQVISHCRTERYL